MQACSVSEHINIIATSGHVLFNSALHLNAIRIWAPGTDSHLIMHFCVEHDIFHAHVKSILDIHKVLWTGNGMKRCDGSSWFSLSMQQLVVFSPPVEGGAFSLDEITNEEALKHIVHLNRHQTLVSNGVLWCQAVCTPTYWHICICTHSKPSKQHKQFKLHAVQFKLSLLQSLWTFLMC